MSGFTKMVIRLYKAGYVEPPDSIVKQPCSPDGTLTKSLPTSGEVLDETTRGTAAEAYFDYDTHKDFSIAHHNARALYPTDIASTGPTYTYRAPVCSVDSNNPLSNSAAPTTGRTLFSGVSSTPGDMQRTVSPSVTTRSGVR